MANRIPDEHRDIHAAADKREPAVERAARRGAAELAEAINLDDLEFAISTGNVKRVMELVTEDLVDKAYEELEERLARAWLEGGSIAASDINEVLEEAADG